MPLLDKSLSVVTQNINRAMNNASIKKTSKNYNIDYGAVNPYQPLYKKVVNVLKNINIFIAYREEEL